ncbi:MAG: cytochrome c [Thermaceae bacterium]|nr:cytochrome c [Thermaceae bacterium]
MKQLVLWAIWGLLALATAQTGAGLYQQNCAFCHGDKGQGRPGAFPPLAGHAPDFLQTPTGRAQLINTLLYGMQGEITAKGQKYNGVMPAFAQLPDEQLAGVLNYILNAWGNDKALPSEFKPITAGEIAAARSARLTPQQVGAARAKLNLP